jgi:hypothetical protein
VATDAEELAEEDRQWAEAEEGLSDLFSHNVFDEPTLYVVGGDPRCVACSRKLANAQYWALVNDDAGTMCAICERCARRDPEVVAGILQRVLDREPRRRFM